MDTTPVIFKGGGGSYFIINSGNVIGLMYGYNTSLEGGGVGTSELINVHEDFFHSIVYLYSTIDYMQN